MPNGGSDCCGTCWFNSENNGGQPESVDDFVTDRKVRCTIRGINIQDPFGTYCANHPNHHSGKIKIPIGPVYITEGYPYPRKVWLKSPDDEQIRLKLLEILNDINLNYIIRYFSPTSPVKIVMQQLAEFKEKRAIPKLIEIIQFNKDKLIDSETSKIDDKSYIIGRAIHTLLEIDGDRYLNDVKHFIDFGLKDFKNKYNEDEDKVSAVRYHLIKGLQHCKQEVAFSLLLKSRQDPNASIRKCAKGIEKIWRRHNLPR